MTDKRLPDLIEELKKVKYYGHPADEIKLVQTHISYVLIAGEFVYKIKKPVDFGFLDFTTLEKRGYYCQQELALNRRLCPEIYLDRLSITRDESGYAFGGVGEVVEYAVKMARMPEERMMGRLLAEQRIRETHLDAIIEKLVPFYQLAAGGDDIKTFGQADSVGVNVLENFEQTEAFVGGTALSRTQFDGISSYARSVLNDTDRFRQRVESGRIKDCHGDLYSANICLAENVYIFDCIEFNERFRYADIAADIAFLAMDLDYHGCNDLSRYFVSRFVEVSGDSGLMDVIDFYKCYRAYVRGKIGLFTAADPAVEPELAETCTEQAARYFNLAERYAGQRR